MDYLHKAGNHDGEVGWTDGTGGYIENASNLSLHARLKYWPAPTNETYSYGGGEYENYYAFDWGDATFIIIDSYRYNTVAPPTGEDWVLGTEQMNWLEDTLSTSDRKWKFIFSHHILGGAPLESGDYNYGDGGGNWSWTGDQRNINHLMEQYNAQIFFYGHVHRSYHDWANWSDFGRTNYVNYVVTVCVSWKDGWSYDCADNERKTIYPGANCRRGYTKVDVSPYNVTFSFINVSDEAILYTYTINNTAPTIELVSPANGATTSSSNLIFTYEDSEYDNAKNCTLYLDGIQYMTQHGISSGTGTTFTATDLSEEPHTWYVNCSDGALSSISETRSFTFFIASNASRSSTYSPSSEQLQRGYNILVRKNQRVRTIINEQVHTAVIKSIDNENKKIEINIEESGKLVEINEGDVGKVDLDDDGYYDLQISCRGIREEGSVDLEFKEIHEEVTADEQKGKKSASKFGIRLKIWIAGAVVVLIIVVLVIEKVLSKRKKRKKRK